MHPKAIELMKKYESINLTLADLNPGNAQYITLAKERAEMEPFIQKYKELDKLEKDILSNKELIESNEDDELRQMAKDEYETLTQRLEDLNQEILLMLLPKDPNTNRNVIVEIRAGAGGDEAAIFVGDLFRMYTRFIDIKRWKYEVMDFNDTGLGGYKEIVFSVKGKDVYGHFKFESGVHRVQRVPETEANGRLHTSTASVAVLSEADEVDVNIDQKDLKIDVYRSSGAGGQHINKTESAVRITHLPTNIVVTCQDERSQLQNRASAMRILRAKLYEQELLRKNSEESELRRSMVGTADRAEKIRTYNYPQNRVSDHRINLTLYKLDRILEGEMDELINALIYEEQQAMLKTIES